MRTRGNHASGWSCEAAGTVCRGAPLRFALLACLGKRVSHARGIEIRGINRCARLLPPGVGDRSGVDGIEAGQVDERHGRGLGRAVVTGHR